MNDVKACARCGKPVPPGRRTYCSEGCADVVAHEKRLKRLAQGKLVLPRHPPPRVYDYRLRPDP